MPHVSKGTGAVFGGSLARFERESNFYGESGGRVP